ncbi:MAG TPA: nuclear transport factor 2 family protein [Solirubrobacteraceae bacterium]
MATPQDTLSAAHASWNAGDLDGYLELYDERIALHGYAPEPMGKAEVRAFYEAVFAAFDSPQLDFQEVLSDGATSTIRFTMTGRHVDELMGVPATGTTSRCPASRSCTSTANA